MNFYEAQDKAHKKTKWLVLYFILAVLGIVMAVYLVYALTLGSVEASYYAEDGVRQRRVSSFWDVKAFMVVAGVTTGVILLGNLFKSLQLAGGGEAVARDIGGRPVDPYTTNLDEKRLINVVEEMAIASGVPAPQVWIMDQEPGINAFAAGTEPGNAVIGVTRGCVQQLTRAELQGVVAHEFSHILNGDMKMNMRLISWLFGIMMLTLLGRMLLESLRFARFRSNSKDNNGGGAILLIVVVGVALLVIGSIGVFFARMIQAAISRQREYLADASAVEFTRDPAGIAGALKKIGGQQYGGKMQSAQACEASHMFFSDAGMFSCGFATHPPLEVRITAIENEWDGKFGSVHLRPVAEGLGAQNKQDERISGFSDNNTAAVTVKPEEWDAMGESSLHNIAVGQTIRASLKEEWIEACHDSEQAQTLLFGLLLAEDEVLREEEITFLNSAASPYATELAIRWHHALKEVHSSKKIALIDLSMPILRRLTALEYERFIKITRHLIASDGAVNLFEFMLQKMIERHLSHYYEYKGNVRVKYTKLARIKNEANVILTTMAGIGSNNDEEVKHSYSDATKELRYELGEELIILPPEKCGLKEVNAALDVVNLASPKVKQQLVYACGVAVMHDGVLANNEAEMLRAVADSVGCSVPPFVKV